jgi:hypothetical protein
MELLKIYEKTCDVCAMLSGIDEQIADDNGMFFRQMTIKDVALNPSDLRDYVVNMYVNPNGGTLDIPTYLVITKEGEIQASGVVKTAEELKNLVAAHQKWTEAQKG